MDSIPSGSGLHSIVWGGNLQGLWFGVVLISVFNKNEGRKKKTTQNKIPCFVQFLVLATFS